MIRGLGSGNKWNFSFLILIMRTPISKITLLTRLQGKNRRRILTIL